ncbi:hypothetical protein BGZ83_008912 [Gryganskiella cystojenkinii]|nr:hypothetical protein BGZ83_008912 [Gryganskiella cystojenkinii]
MDLSIPPVPPVGEVRRAETVTWAFLSSSQNSAISPKFSIGQIVIQVALENILVTPVLKIERFDDSTRATTTGTVTLEMNVYGNQRQVNLGKYTFQITSKSGHSERPFFVTSAQLRKYNCVVIDFRIQGIDSAPTKPVLDLLRDSSQYLSALWQDPSTCDVAIHCADDSRVKEGDDQGQHGKGEGTMVLVHKAYVLNQLPNLAQFLGLESLKVPTIDARDNSITDMAIRDLKVEVADLKRIIATQQAAYTEILSTGPQKLLGDQKERDQTSTQKTSSKSASSVPDSAKGPIDDEIDDWTLSSTSASTSSCSCCGSTSSSPAVVGSDSAPSVGPEIWYWPERFPSQTCYQVMRWVYFRELSTPSTEQLKDFEVWFELCEALSLPKDAFCQEYVEKVKAFIKDYERPIELIAILDYNRDHAKEYLRPVLVSALETHLNAWFAQPSLNEWPQDPSGVLWEVLRKRVVKA